MKQAIRRWFDTYWPLLFTFTVLIGSLAMIAYAAFLDFGAP